MPSFNYGLMGKDFGAPSQLIRCDKGLPSGGGYPTICLGYAGSPAYAARTLHATPALLSLTAPWTPPDEHHRRIPPTRAPPPSAWMHDIQTASQVTEFIGWGPRKTGRAYTITPLGGGPL